MRMITSRSVAAPLEVFLQMLLFRVLNTSGKSLLQRKLRVSNRGRGCLNRCVSSWVPATFCSLGISFTSLRNAEVFLLTDDTSQLICRVLLMYLSQTGMTYISVPYQLNPWCVIIFPENPKSIVN